MLFGVNMTQALNTLLKETETCNYQLRFITKVLVWKVSADVYKDYIFAE